MKNPRKALRLAGVFGADDGNRTHTASLGSWSSTTKLHLHFFFIIIYPLYANVKLFYVKF